MVRQPLRFRGLEKSKVQVQVYCTLFQLIQYKIAYKISRLTNDQINMIYWFVDMCTVTKLAKAFMSSLFHLNQ